MDPAPKLTWGNIPSVLMKLTEEQQAIVGSRGDIKINAVAGSGKTTTVVEYAKSRPRSAKILYLAFNKSVKLEAVQKFKQKGLHNVRVETAHSLAYKHVVFKNDYKVRAQGYKTHEIAQLLGLDGRGEKHTKYIIANHITRFIAYFCNSDKHKVQDLNYLDTITDKKARTFVRSFYRYIEKQTRILLAKMDSGDIEITHDFYLKKFQLSRPKLNFDYILFDEAQDASAAMLDVVQNQKAVKVIVGDTHQQIYGWRYAINSLEKTPFQTYQLSTSFRFSQDIADLAMGTLLWKKWLDSEPDLCIKGRGKSKENTTKAVIARTNLGLLLKAIEYVTEKKNLEKIYFEGNINSYTYATEGASLYDVLNLHTNRHWMVKDKLIKEMGDLDELEDYIKKTEDVQLGMMVEIVKKYGNKIPSIIKKIRNTHIEGDDKTQAELIFSTVHRCKGMEYDSVQLVNDFTNEEKLRKILNDIDRDSLDYNKLNEEINLLYVAITRAKNQLYIPEELVPDGTSRSDHIHFLSIHPNRENTADTTEQNTPSEEKTVKSYSVYEIRKKHKAAYQPWTQDLDDELTTLYCEGQSIRDMAAHFGRTRGSIRSRIKKLELAETYG